jgi:hypothetical protein
MHVLSNNLHHGFQTAKLTQEGEQKNIDKKTAGKRKSPAFFIAQK